MRAFFICLGCLSVALGVAGIFLPLMPTTPFLLLAAYLFARSSTRLYNWLLSHRLLGPYIRDYLTHRIIPMRIKVLSISLLWASILSCVFFVTPALVADIVLISIAAGVSAYILSFRSKKKDQNG